MREIKFSIRRGFYEEPPKKLEYEKREVWIVNKKNETLRCDEMDLPKDITAEELWPRFWGLGYTYFTKEEAEKAIRDLRDEKKNQKQEAILAKKRYKDALKK